MNKVAAISIDLDEIDCYAAIHGLSEGTLPRRPVYETAIGRFLRWFDALGIQATLFAIGRDLEDPHNTATIAACHRAGHEIGNHSYAHRYDLTRQASDAITQDIRRGADTIERATGRRPRGFRAPGYTITDPVFDALSALGVTYDSSVFPCPAYYAAKVTAISAIALRGRHSHSIVDDPRMLGAPAGPYRVGRPYYTRGASLIELPIGVTPLARLPFIGTSVTASGVRGARWLAQQMSARAFVNLELHGIDLLDREDGLAALARHQPDLRIPWARKQAALTAAVLTLRERGFTFTTLERVADEHARTTRSHP